MDTSIFMEKDILPDEETLKASLGETYSLWQAITGYVYSKYPNAVEDWTYPGKKYGWNFRVKDKKRAIIYLLPREKFFKVAFVFGQKATDIILQSDISEAVKSELEAATVYAEGRGIRIDVTDGIVLGEIWKLIDIKLAN